MTDTPQYQIDRFFAAPRALVWKCWTDPELLARWYGPGIETIIHRFDLMPDGEWRNEMKWGDKSDLSKMVFQEVTPQERLVWLHSSTDADWNIVGNPMMPDWPKTLLTTVTFTDANDGTNVRLCMRPHKAAETEAACFASAMAKMDGGWGSGYKIIDEILEELQSGND